MTRNEKIRRAAGTALIVIAAVLAGAAGCGKSANDQYTEGKSLVSNPETTAQGLEVLEKFVKRFARDSRAPEVMLAIATINQSEKRFPEAEKAYLRLIEKFPSASEACKARFLLGYMYYDDMKDTEKAKKVLNDFVAAYPESSLAVSAKVLLENIGLPVEEWSTVKKIATEEKTDTGTTAPASSTKK